MKSVLDSRQLLAASVLARTGSFTLTGMQLSLTQSAVSHAIKGLEEEVECRLFTRTGKGVMATPAGKHFLSYTEEILAQMETARTLVAPRTTRGKERLRLGVSFRAREYFLPIVLPLFQKEYSNKLVTIEPVDYGRNLELLGSGLLDLVFSVRPRDRPEFSFVNLFEDELRFVVAASHPWAKAHRASSIDFSEDCLILHQQINNTPQLLADHFRTQGLQPGSTVALGDYQAIKAVVKTGHAVGVLPAWLFAEEIREGSLVSIQLGLHPLVRQWGLAYLPSPAIGAMDLRFIELCQQAVPGILSRLQGRNSDAREKKAMPAETVADRRLHYGPVAMALAAVCNLFSESPVGQSWDTVIGAFS